MKLNSRSVNLFSVMSTSIVRLLLAAHRVIFGLSLECDIVLLLYSCGNVIVDLVPRPCAFVACSTKFAQRAWASLVHPVITSFPGLSITANVVEGLVKLLRK